MYKRAVLGQNYIYSGQSDNRWPNNTYSIANSTVFDPLIYIISPETIHFVQTLIVHLKAMDIAVYPKSVHGPLHTNCRSIYVTDLIPKTCLNYETVPK